MAAHPSGEMTDVDRVLLHHHAVSKCDRNGATRATLTDHASHRWYAEPRHHELAPRYPTSLPVLLGSNTREGTRRVDERDQREPMAMCQFHHPDALAIPLRVGHPEVASGALVNIAALLMADQGHALAAEAAKTTDKGGVVAEVAVAVKLDEIIKQALYVVQRVGPVLVARQFHSSPYLFLARLGLRALDLLL